MTIQTPDRITINGQTFYTRSFPLNTLPDRRELPYLPITSCYRGYIAEWKIENERLYLENISLTYGGLAEEFYPIAACLPAEASFYSGIIKFWSGNDVFFMGIEIINGKVVPLDKTSELTSAV